MSLFSTPIKDVFAKDHPSEKNPLNRFYFLYWHTVLPIEIKELIPF